MSTMREETLGTTLRRLRESRGLGLRALARLARASHGSLLDWETDRFVPSGPALDRVLAALEAPSSLRARLIAGAAPAYARVQLAHTRLGAPVEIGAVLRAMRLRRGMAQAEAARTVGVSQSALAKWETGDSVPSRETLHEALFAFGASDDEALALMVVERRTAAEGDGADIEARILRASFNTPIALRDVVLLGIESELWWRATKDPSVESLLGYAIASRAHQCLWRGAIDEIDGHVRRAVDLAQTTGRHDYAAGAVYASNWVRQRASGSALAARKLRAWRDLMSKPLLRKWLTGAQATATIRAGDVEGGLGLLEDLERESLDESWARVVYHRGDLAEALLLAGRPERALNLLRTLGPAARPWSVVKAHLALGAEPPADALSATTAFDPDDWLLRRESSRIRRLIERRRAA